MITSPSQSQKEHSLEEVALGVVAGDAPPVVDEHVEYGEQDDEERGRPLGLEADGDHPARDEAEDGDEHAGDGPFALDDEPDEKEDEEDSSDELEATKVSQPS